MFALTLFADYPIIQLYKVQAAIKLLNQHNKHAGTDVPQ
jgi:hypothetical protein